MVGCKKNDNIIGNTTSVVLSTTLSSIPLFTTSISTATSTTSDPTTTASSYDGQVVLALAGEGPADIWIDKYYCYPNVLTVEMGTKVTWTDFDIVSFTVVSNDGLFAGNIDSYGGKWSYLFAEPGYFGYSVDPYNGELRGVVIVLG